MQSVKVLVMKNPIQRGARWGYLLLESFTVSEAVKVPCEHTCWEYFTEMNAFYKQNGFII